MDGVIVGIFYLVCIRYPYFLHTTYLYGTLVSALLLLRQIYILSYGSVLGQIYNCNSIHLGDGELLEAG